MTYTVLQKYRHTRKSILPTQGPIHEILAVIAKLLGVVKKLSFFESAISKKKNFFCLIPIKISQNLYDSKDFSKFWWLPWFPESFWCAYTFATQCSDD